MKEKILGILICTLLITTIFAGAVTANTKRETQLEQDKKTPAKIQLTEEELDKLDGRVNNIEKEEMSEKVQDILERAINPDGELDVEALIAIFHDEYEAISGFLGPAPEERSIQLINGSVSYSSKSSSGESTVFKPPYDSCYSWGEIVWGDCEHSSNANSGAIGVVAIGWVGGATAEAVQSINFYVGRNKQINVNAEFIRIGGADVIGLGFADTKLTWHIDDWENYYQELIDFVWGWGISIDIIMWLVERILSVPFNDIFAAIAAMNQIEEYIEMYDIMMGLVEDGNADILHLDFSMDAEPGWHTIWVGTRANVGAFVTGYGQGVSAGNLASIEIWGICRPDAPVISGPDHADPGELCEFYVCGDDPNNDDVQYQIDWGDGELSPWTSFVPSGTQVCMSHSYQEEDKYIVRAHTRDIDLMESDWTEYILWIGNAPPNTPRIPIGPLYGKVGIEYEYRTNASDPNEDQIFYQWNWTHEISDWYGPYVSNEICRVSHIFPIRGVHLVTVRAKDAFGLMSNWSPPLPVTVPVNQNSINLQSLKFLLNLINL